MTHADRPLTTTTVTGRAYSHTRPRGAAPWRPQAKARATLEHVLVVLDEYADHLPLTGRQVFYRLVGAYGYDKTEAGYARLLDVLNRARRAGRVPWGAIRDDGAVVAAPHHFDGMPGFWRAVRDTAGAFRLDRQAGQPLELEVWCEAAGMVPQLARVADPFGVAVYSSGGFDSVTVKRDAAARIVNRSRPTCVLHIGDLDADGCAIVDAAADDVIAFCNDAGGIAPTFVRVALTPAQVRDYSLPTAPQKARKDGQRLRGGALAETVQAEALEPATLVRLVRDSIEARIDRAALDRVMAHELDVRAELVAAVDRFAP